jgi:hypothetical protein
MQDTRGKIQVKKAMELLLPCTLCLETWIWFELAEKTNSVSLPQVIREV